MIYTIHGFTAGVFTGTWVSCYFFWWVFGGWENQFSHEHCNVGWYPTFLDKPNLQYCWWNLSNKYPHQMLDVLPFCRYIWLYTPIISSISLIRSLISHINVRLYIYNYMLYRIFLVTSRRVLVQHCLDSIWPMRNGQAAQSLAPQARLRLSHAVGSPSGIFATLQG